MPKIKTKRAPPSGSDHRDRQADARQGWKKHLLGGEASQAEAAAREGYADRAGRRKADAPPRALPLAGVPRPVAARKVGSVTDPAIARGTPFRPYRLPRRDRRSPADSAAYRGRAWTG